ncbi:MAG: DUF4241 domain-containing protein [Bacilli bacterium]|nr:DUF4241 domain-containing protein [Bacilli bacterium]
MGIFRKEKKEKDINEIFAANLKYISQTEIDCNVIEQQFVKDESHFYLTVGEINCPTGRIAVSDPLCYLAWGDFSPVLDKTIEKGIYPVEVAIFRNEMVGIRMCTARLKIKSTKAVRYECAKSTEESAVAKGKDGAFSGFPVDAGMISFCDEQVAKEYQDFIGKWHEENKDKNHYDDYFAEFFQKSAQEYPQYQREDGDFIEWENPKTKNKMVMIASGFGDGFYQAYWGYDNKDEICELIVPMINPSLFEE